MHASCSFPMSPHIRALVGLSVSRLVGRSVCHYFRQFLNVAYIPPSSGYLQGKNRLWFYIVQTVLFYIFIFWDIDRFKSTRLCIYTRSLYVKIFFLFIIMMYKEGLSVTFVWKRVEFKYNLLHVWNKVMCLYIYKSISIRINFYFYSMYLLKASLIQNLDLW